MKCGPTRFHHGCYIQIQLPERFIYHAASCRRTGLFYGGYGSGQISHNSRGSAPRNRSFPRFYDVYRDYRTIFGYPPHCTSSCRPLP
ncbi:hypothetical protein FKM82_001445 [Ascaphus truei]